MPSKKRFTKCLVQCYDSVFVETATRLTTFFEQELHISYLIVSVLASERHGCFCFSLRPGANIHFNEILHRSNETKFSESLFCSLFRTFENLKKTMRIKSFGSAFKKRTKYVCVNFYNFFLRKLNLSSKFLLITK